MEAGNSKSRVKRAEYNPSACAQCRKSKTRCLRGDDTSVCARCTRLGHDCEWGRSSRRQAITRHRVQSFQSNIDALQAEVKILQERLLLHESSLPSAHPGIAVIPENPKSQTPEQWQAQSLLEQTSDSDPTPISTYDSDSDSESGNVGAVFGPKKTLFRENDDFIAFGPTAVFRLRAASAVQSLRALDVTSGTSGKTHVLLLPGEAARAHCDCWSRCWSRHIPQFHVVPLTREEHDRLLDITFRFFTCWCLRIIPELFLRDMYRVLHTPSGQPVPKTAHYSPLLHNSLLAVATAFSDDPRVLDMKARWAFAENAKNYVESECERPSISAVQALSILASFYSGQGQQTLGFMRFGMSARLSQALGLGIDCSQWVKAGFITTADMFDRNWAFHMNCAQDACWSMYVGRDFGIPLKQSDIQQLAYVSDPGLDQAPWEWKSSKVPSQPSYILKTFIATCELLLISRRIMDAMNGLSSSNDKQPNLLITEIDKQLTTWKDNLAPELQMNTSHAAAKALPHKLMLHLAFWWLMVLLHRPLYRGKRVAGINLHPSVSRCNTAAGEIKKLLRVWDDLYSLRYTPITLIQAAFSAGTIFLLSAEQANMGIKPAPVTHAGSLDSLEEIIDALRKTGRTWQCAAKIADIFETLLKARRRPVEDAAIEKAPPNRKMKGPALLSHAPAVLGNGPGSSGSFRVDVALAGESQSLSEPSLADDSDSAMLTMDGPFKHEYGPPQAPLYYYEQDAQNYTQDSGSSNSPDFDMVDVFDPRWIGLGMVDGQSLSNQPYIAPGVNSGHGPLQPQWSDEDRAMLDLLMQQGMF